MGEGLAAADRLAKADKGLFKQNVQSPEPWIVKR